MQDSIDRLITATEQLILKSSDKEEQLEIVCFDNPGWGISIPKNLDKSLFHLTKYKIERTEHDWLHVLENDDTWLCACGPSNLMELINFITGVRYVEPSYIRDDENNSSILIRLEKWYVHICETDKYHEGIWRVEIKTEDGPLWKVRINILNTYLEDLEFKAVSSIISQKKWYKCEILGENFQANCTLRELDVVLDIFLKWAGF